MGPSGWEFAYDAIFQLLFALITFLIGMFALKIYNFTEQRQLKIFSLSFLSISASFVALALMNLGITTFFANLLNMDPIGVLRLVLASHMGLYIIGVITLAYMTLKIKSHGTYVILLAITFISIIVSASKLYLFYLIASAFLGYVFYYYYQSYRRSNHLKNLLVMLGFGFLFAANIFLIFSVQDPFYYVSGHFLELIGYLLLLVNLWMVMK